MSASSYDAALARLLVHEGGYTNHPSDPGGPTNWGITLGDYRRYINANATANDVRTMPVAAAKRIYRTHYWDALRCDELPAGLDYCTFDYGVNSGIGRAAKVLQRCLGRTANGHLDNATVRAAGSARGLVEAVCDERLRFLQSLRTWPVFGAGWGRRVREVRAASLAMANKTAAPPAADRPDTPAPGKGSVPLNDPARKTTTGGTVAAGGAAAAQSSDGATIVIVLVLTLAIAVGAWFFWHWWQRRQQDAPH
jgi:lysozyme family protein